MQTITKTTYISQGIICPKCGSSGTYMPPSRAFAISDGFEFKCAACHTPFKISIVSQIPRSPTLRAAVQNDASKACLEYVHDIARKTHPDWEYCPTCGGRLFTQTSFGG